VISIRFTPESDSFAYRFQGGSGTVTWPRDLSVLGPGGVWNLFWRLGQPLPEPVSGLDGGTKGAIFLHLNAPLSGNERTILQGILNCDTPVLASGKPTGLASLPGIGPFIFPDSEPRPYAGFLARWEEGDEFLAGSGAAVFRYGVDGPGERRGQVVALGGERQSPARALRIEVPDAPLALRFGSLVVLNADPFAAFQGWLQGHQSLLPWVGWRHRMFWLDEQASFLGRLVARVAPEVSADLPAPTSLPLPPVTVVLRHDLDESRDRSFLDHEIAGGLSATHAILLDKNRRYWINTLQAAPAQEPAFHYTSGSIPSLLDRVLARFQRGVVPISPDVFSIAAGGLLRQVRQARIAGIGITTLHRHLGYLYYPETVEALGAAFRAYPDEILGSSSFFRARVIRWGEPVSGVNADVGEMPDSQFPLWIPFRLWDSARHELHRGWEITLVMEPEPEFVHALLHERVASLPNIVLPIVFHPAHAVTRTFRSAGTLPWFRDITDLLRREQVGVMTLRDVFAACGRPWMRGSDVTGAGW